MVNKVATDGDDLAPRLDEVAGGRNDEVGVTVGKSAWRDGFEIDNVVFVPAFGSLAYSNTVPSVHSRPSSPLQILSLPSFMYII